MIEGYNRKKIKILKENTLQSYNLSLDPKTN